MAPTQKAKGLETAKLYNLNEIIDYSEDSIISRIIAKNDSGSMTLFSFDRGQNLSEHSTPYNAVVQVLDGEVELVIGGESLIARAGETVVMPADVPHAVNSVTRFKMLLTMLKG
jgi:quercetin dioxygenase-like cupin family protein